MGGALAGFLGVALALMVVACDLPPPEAGSENGGAARAEGELFLALDQERLLVARAVSESWGAAPLEPPDPGVRARRAASALETFLAARYPTPSSAVAVEALEMEVSMPAEESDLLPPEIQVRARLTLRATLPSGEAREARVEAAEPDPLSPRGRAFLAATLSALATDPWAAVGAAMRLQLKGGAAAGAMPPDEAGALVDAALQRAEGELTFELASRSGEGPFDFASRLVDLDTPEPDDAASAPALAAANATAFCDFARGFFASRAGAGAVAAALLPFVCGGGPWRSALLAVLAGNGTLLRAGLFAVWAIAESAWGAFLEGARALVRAYGWAAANATRRAQTVWDELAPRQAAAHAAAPDAEVSLAARGASITIEPLPASPAPPGFLPVAAAKTVVQFTLAGSARVLERGRWVEAAIDAPARFEWAGAGRGLPDLPAPRQPDAAEAALIERAPGLADSAAGLDDLRREIDRRLFTFGDAVSQRLAHSSASAVARLALRVLEGFADPDHARSARALFELMERYFAEDLSRALSVKATVWGVSFTLIPDPVHQQVSLEHQDGPHTIGARVRRVTDPDNPLAPKWRDHLSLTLELYWRYDAAPVHAMLVLDPFLRTGEGLVRFDLRVIEGEGLHISVVAPRVVRRAGSLELSLSDFVPGGIPLGLTPTGGLLSFDAGVRVEFSRLAPAPLWQFVARAAGAAILDGLSDLTVKDAAGQLAAAPLARAFVGRLVARLADTFSDSASRFVIRADLFARLRWAEAAGAVSGELEFGVGVLEPMKVMREVASAASALVADAMAGTAPPRGGPLRPLDWLPTAVHERVGPTLALRARAGLDGIPVVGRWLEELPRASVGETMFASLGAIAAVGGRRDVHWVTEFALGFEVPATPSQALQRLGLARGDTLEAAHLRVESLAGPRILISEALPSPSGADTDLEFVELYNPAFVEEDLSGWVLTDGSGRAFALPDGTRIAAGKTLLIARSALPFFQRFAVAPDVPTLTLALNDEGDRLRLTNARGWESDSVEWGDGSLRAESVPPDTSLTRQAAPRAPPQLPGSALRFSGSWTDFAKSQPSPGRLA